MAADIMLFDVSMPTMDVTSLDRQAVRTPSPHPKSRIWSGFQEDGYQITVSQWKSSPGDR